MNWEFIEGFITGIILYFLFKRNCQSRTICPPKDSVVVYCKICNKNIVGNGYCAEHSTSGTSYIETIKKGTKK